MTSLISVIMSVYNEKENWLRESIQSILNQTYINFEFIIIIDNPSNYVLIDIVKEYAQIDHRIKFYINTQNQGLVYSLNRALKYTKGDYIARMDADDISHHNRLEKQLEYIQKNQLDLIGANINLFDKKQEIFYTTDKLLTHEYIKKLLYYGTTAIAHPTFFARKEVYITLNGYKNSLYTEDKEFLARAFCHHFKIGNTKDVLLDYRYNDQSITKGNAIYVNKIGKYITKVFKVCLKEGSYNFNESYHLTIKITEDEKKVFKQKQILMGEARKALFDKNYFKFIQNIFQAFYYTKDSTWLTIRVNFIYKYLRFIERMMIENGENKYGR